MRARIAAFVAGLAVLAGTAAPGWAGSISTDQSASPPTAQAAHTCTGNRRHAIIGGAHKCLARGQFCAKARAREYRRYRFACAPDSAGRYRLR